MCMCACVYELSLASLLFLQAATGARISYFPAGAKTVPSTSRGGGGGVESGAAYMNIFKRIPICMCMCECVYELSLASLLFLQAATGARISYFPAGAKTVPSSSGRSSFGGGGGDLGSGMGSGGSGQGAGGDSGAPSGFSSNVLPLAFASNALSITPHGTPTGILPGAPSGISSDTFSGILSSNPSRIPSGTPSGVASGFPSGVSDTPSGMPFGDGSEGDVGRHVALCSAGCEAGGGVGGVGADDEMLTPTGYPPLLHSSRHGSQRTQHTASTAATPRYPQGERQTPADAPTPPNRSTQGGTGPMTEGAWTVVGRARNTRGRARNTMGGARSPTDGARATPDPGEHMEGNAWGGGA